MRPSVSFRDRDAARKPKQLPTPGVRDDGPTVSIINEDYQQVASVPGVCKHFFRQLNFTQLDDTAGKNLCFIKIKSRQFFSQRPLLFISIYGGRNFGTKTVFFGHMPQKNIVFNIFEITISRPSFHIKAFLCIIKSGKMGIL